MTKIAIISQPEQGVVIDVSGCSNPNEASQHLISTLEVSNQFWEEMNVDLNLGKLVLTRDEVAQVLSILTERGVKPSKIYSESELTKASLNVHRIQPAHGAPASLPTGSSKDDKCDTAIEAPTKASVRPAAKRVPKDEVKDATEDSGKNQPSSAQASCQASDSSEKAASDTTASPEAAAKDPEATAPEGNEPEAKDASAEAADAEAGDKIESGKETPVKTAPQTPHVLLLKQTLRSGMAVSHKGHLVILGDVNAGAEVIAEGDITIWGALRGMAHAGVGGNTNAEIRALKLQPLQLRIANAIARAPDRPSGSSVRSTGPETARIINGTIRIASSAPE